MNGSQLRENLMIPRGGSNAAGRYCRADSLMAIGVDDWFYDEFIHVLPVLAIIIELIRIDDSEEETLAASSQIEE
jgi:hypothetical protein